MMKWDYGLWLHRSQIHIRLKIAQKQFAKKCICVIRKMFESGWIVIGQPVRKDGQIIFQLFSMTFDDAITFIESEWIILGRLPNLGEICWFTATPLGMQLAKDLGLL